MNRKQPERREKNKEADLKYRQVAISAIDRGRRGKHHDLVAGIFLELDLVPPGSAIEVPLANVGGIGLANLRSAVHRASTSKGLSIQTFADERNLYVWKNSRNDSPGGG